MYHSLKKQTMIDIYCLKNIKKEKVHVIVCFNVTNALGILPQNLIVKPHIFGPAPTCAGPKMWDGGSRKKKGS